MKKIFFVNRYFYPDHSATSQLLTDLAFHLATQHFQTYVITSRQRYDDPSAQLRAVEEIGRVQVRRVWTSRFGRGRLLLRTLDYLTFYVSSAWCLLKLIKRGDVVIAKTDPPLISVIAALVAHLRGATLINWTQDLFPEIAQILDMKVTWVVSRLLKVLRNFSFQIARRNVVLGNRMAERVLSEGVSPATVRVIHNWADGAEICPIDRNANPLRKRWGFGDTFVVGYSGNMGRAHEFNTILEAAEILRHTDSVCFLFIGSGVHLPSLKGKVQERGLTNVLFKPYQPRDQLGLSLTLPDVHLISLMPALEGLIVPSKFYGIAAAGRPIIYIGDRDGEIPCILEKSNCGYTISIGDAEELTDHILAMAQDTERIDEMGVRARLVFDQRYDKRHAFAAWEQLLTEI